MSCNILSADVCGCDCRRVKPQLLLLASLRMHCSKRYRRARPPTHQQVQCIRDRSSTLWVSVISTRLDTACAAAQESLRRYHVDRLTSPASHAHSSATHYTVHVHLLPIGWAKSLCYIIGFCDNSLHKKLWRVRKRGTQAMRAHQGDLV